MSRVGKYCGMLLSVMLLLPSVSVVAEEKMMAASEVIKVKKDRILVKGSRKYLCITTFNKVKGKYVQAVRHCLSKQTISRYSVDLTNNNPVVILYLNTCSSPACSSRISFELDLLLYDAKGVLVTGDNKEKQKAIAKKMFNDIGRALSR